MTLTPLTSLASLSLSNPLKGGWACKGLYTADASRRRALACQFKETHLPTPLEVDPPAELLTITPNVHQADPLPVLLSEEGNGPPLPGLLYGHLLCCHRGVFPDTPRSEERRVGGEWRDRWG